MYDSQLKNDKEGLHPVEAELSSGISRAEAAREEYNIPLGDFLQAVKQRLFLIFFVVVVLVGGTVGISLAQAPMYEASIKILIGQEQGSSSPGNLGGDVQGLQQLTQTMAEAANSRPVAESVIK